MVPQQEGCENMSVSQFSLHLSQTNGLLAATKTIAHGNIATPKKEKIRQNKEL